MSDFAATFRSTACLLYHFVAGLSRGFFKLFWVFSTLTWALLLLYALADSFVIISLLLHFVNTFFSLFSRFFIFSFAKLLIAKATLLLCCRKDFALSDWLYRLRSKAATTRRCAPHLHSKCKRLRRRLLVNLRSRWSLTYMINFIIAHLNSSVARFRISLSSGIRMFARER